MSNYRCEVSLITTKETCEINTPFRLTIAALFEFLTSAQLIQTTQTPSVRVVTHVSFTAAYAHPSQPTQLTIHRSIHFLKLQFPVYQSSLQPESSQTNMFRRNAVATASRVINDSPTVCRNCDAATVPKNPSTRSGFPMISCLT